MNAVQLEDYNYGRQYEWLVETVEERIRDNGFDAYQEFSLNLEGAHDEKFVNAMAIEIGLIVGKMTTEYLQVCLGNSDYRPVVALSSADPGRSVSIFDPSQQRFHQLPAAAFPWPFYLSGVDRILGLGESRKANRQQCLFLTSFQLSWARSNGQKMRLQPDSIPNLKAALWIPSACLGFRSRI